MDLNEPKYRQFGSLGLAIIMAGLFSLLSFSLTITQSKFGMIISFLIATLGFMITAGAILIDWDKK